MNYNQIDLVYSININIKYALAMYKFYISSFSMLRYNLALGIILSNFFMVFE
jgi:hypothetical protein